MVDAAAVVDKGSVDDTVDVPSVVVVIVVVVVVDVTYISIR